MVKRLVFFFLVLGLLSPGLVTADNDAVPDGSDYCVNTPAACNASVNAFGCSIVPGCTDTYLWTPSADAYITNSSPVNNFGTTDPLAIGLQGSQLSRALLDFDLTAIPATAVISSAQLDLYWNAAGATVNFAFAPESWVEGTGNNVPNNATVNGTTWQSRWNDTNWSTAGAGLSDPSGCGISATPVAASWTNTPVTCLVSYWLGNMGGVFGLGLLSSNEAVAGSATVDSRTGANKPLLTVTYSIPAPPPPPKKSKKFHNIEITEFDETIEAEPGEVTLHFRVENTGDFDEYDINTFILNLPSGWSGETKSFNLDEGEDMDVELVLVIPPIQPDTFNFFIIQAGNDMTSDKQFFQITVLPQCQQDDDCAETDFCYQNVCTPVRCENVENHRCASVAPEPPPEKPPSQLPEPTAKVIGNGGTREAKNETPTGWTPTPELIPPVSPKPPLRIDIVPLLLVISLLLLLFIFIITARTLGFGKPKPRKRTTLEKLQK